MKLNEEDNWKKGTRPTTGSAHAMAAANNPDTLANHSTKLQAGSFE